ncbi:hypothetical protein Pmani_032428 [Petrolisthes manimaculis]|uniref:Uncharacterized protein n=1 Tax=Petrolisthes manimaculis TaxID=1843537 RepID=A0AAE1NT27_9EUCA|nr:hypothetical protein Pmani_032428 [Petrolisthes manimaculis]
MKVGLALGHSRLDSQSQVVEVVVVGGRLGPRPPATSTTMGQTGGLSVHKYLKCGGSGSGKARDTTTTSYYARLRIMWLRPAAKSRLTTPDYSQVTGSLTRSTDYGNTETRLNILPEDLFVFRPNRFREGGRDGGGGFIKRTPHG